MEQSLRQLALLFELADEFYTDTNCYFAVALAATGIGIGSAFFLHFDLVHAMVLSQISLFTGLISAMAPAFGSKCKQHCLQACHQREWLTIEQPFRTNQQSSQTRLSCRERI